MTVNLTTAEAHSVNQSSKCEVSRLLWSVGKICDAGCTVTFDSKGATVKHSATGKDLCSFERRGGLYLASLPLSKPSKPSTPAGEGQQGFTRRG